jgi:hypothetical protein
MGKHKNVFAPNIPSIIQNVYGSLIYSGLGLLLLWLGTTLDPWRLRTELSLASTIVFYSLLSIGCLTIIYWIVNSIRKIFARKKPLDKIVDQVFRNSTIYLDGKHFIKCTFENCTLYWQGGRCRLDDITFQGIQGFRTENTTVSDTVTLLKNMNLLRIDFAKDWSPKSSDWLRGLTSRDE